MPVFGKGRKERERRNFLKKEVRRDSKGKREYGLKTPYIFVNRSAKTIRKMFPLLFGKDGFVEQRFEENQRPVVVLDWGCGKGRAIKEFANDYGEKVRAYGFSKDSYKQWKGIEGVKLIHETKEGLLRFLKNDSVDLIYSNFGLSFLFPTFKFQAKRRHVEKGVEYIEKLLQRVSKGGKIAFEESYTMGKRVRAILKSELAGKAEIEYHKGMVYLTKK